MKVSRDEFFSRAASVGVDPAQAAALWAELAKQEHASAPGAAFTAANVAYYLGGAIVICAMTFFMVQVWSNDAEIVALALCYMVLLGVIGGWLYRRPETRRPGGILVTAATSLTPLLVYGLIKLSGGWTKANDPGSYSAFYEVVNKSWVPMEIATIVVGLVALRFVRFPFLTLPVAFALWFLSMDATGLFTHADAWSDAWLDTRRTVSIAFGIVMLSIAVAVDRRTDEDYGFWLYLYGTSAFAFGITILWDKNQWHLAAFALICLGMIVVSVLLGRRVLTVAGGLGIFSYCSQLAYEYFKSEQGIFVLALTLIGLAVIFVGIAYQRNEATIQGALLAACPGWLVKALPRSRAA